VFELSDFLTRIKATVRALLPEHWQGEAGERFRDTMATLSEYSKNNVRVRERLKEAPEIIWETLKQKSSEALMNAAEEEEKRIANELAKQTLPAKRRQEEAIAEKSEAEVRLMRIQELEARLAFIERLRQLGMICVWDVEGNMAFAKAPTDYNWDGLIEELVTNKDGLQLHSSSKQISLPRGAVSEPNQPKASPENE
jgi:uncharacterized protein YukE